MKVTKSHWFLFLASLGMSFVFVFSTFLKNSGMSSLEQVGLRIFTAFAFLLLFLVFTKSIRLPAAAHVPFFLAIGIAWGLFLFSSLSAITLGAPIVVAGALVYTQPIYTALISFAADGERPSKKKIFLILAAVIGAFLASGFYLPKFGEIRMGVLVAALTGLLYAIYLRLKRNPISKRYPPLSSLANTMIFAMPTILLMGAVLSVMAPNRMLVSLEMPDSYQVFMIVLFALFSTLLPYGALNSIKNEEIGATTEGLLLLLDSVFKVVWSVLLFGQFLTVLQYVGVGLMLVALSLNVSGHKPTTITAPIAS